MSQDGEEDRKVPVRIQLESDSDGEKLSQQLTGEWYAKGRAVYLRYEESEDSRTVRTLLMWKDGQLRLTRKGDVESEQTFSAGGKFEGFYRAETVRFELETVTSLLRIVASGEEGEEGEPPTPALPMLFEWHYELWTGGEKAGLFKVRLLAEPADIHEGGTET
jgi:uncharacterized beta-barrel protein YwiB (DUF1934 family)